MSAARARRTAAGAQELLGGGLSRTQVETVAAGRPVQKPAAPAGGGSDAQGRAETEQFQRLAAVTTTGHVDVVVVARQRLQATFGGVRVRRLRRLLPVQLRQL